MNSFADPGTVLKGAIATQSNLTATPTLYLLDHKGVIRQKWVGNPGEKAINAALKKLIQQAEPAAPNPPN